MRILRAGWKGLVSGVDDRERAGRLCLADVSSLSLGAQKADVCKDCFDREYPCRWINLVRFVCLTRCI